VLRLLPEELHIPLLLVLVQLAQDGLLKHPMALLLFLEVLAQLGVVALVAAAMALNMRVTVVLVAAAVELF
jgi:hypothetical protein